MPRREGHTTLEVEIRCDENRVPTLPVATARAVLEATPPFYSGRFTNFRDIPLPVEENWDVTDTKAGTKLRGDFTEGDVKRLADGLCLAGGGSAWIELYLRDDAGTLLAVFAVNGHLVEREGP